MACDKCPICGGELTIDNDKEVDHSGNREYAGFFNNRAEALREAEKLNYIEENTSPCTVRQMTSAERERYFGKE